jgi:hypothetical protein
MTTVANIAAKIAKGYGSGATRLGRSTSVYRPSGAGNPIVGGNLVQTILAAFDTAPGFSFVNPQKFGQVTYYALMDATNVRVGDYLVSGSVKYLVATVDDFAAPMVQRCDRVLTVKRASQVAGSYSGDIRGNETTLLTAWPAVCVYGTKGQANAAGLPGDVREPWWSMILPASVPVQIRSSDIIEDDQAQPMRYIVSSAELSALGLRMTAAQAVT